MSVNARPKRSFAVGVIVAHPWPQGPESLPEAGGSACRWCRRSRAPPPPRPGRWSPSVSGSRLWCRCSSDTPALHQTSTDFRNLFHFAAAGALSLLPTTPGRNGVGRDPEDGPSLPLNLLFPLGCQILLGCSRACRNARGWDPPYFQQTIPAPPRNTPNHHLWKTNPSARTSPCSHGMRRPQTRHPQTHHPQARHPQTHHPQTRHPQTRHPQTHHPQTRHPQTHHPQTHHPQARCAPRSRCPASPSSPRVSVVIRSRAATTSGCSSGP